MKKRSLRTNQSGQVIVISALMIALILLSTAIFVIQTEKNVPTDTADANNALLVYQQASRNTLISALSNVTDSGQREILQSDLNNLNAVTTSNSYQTIVSIAFTPQNTFPYQSGFWITWGANGQGLSSVSVNFSYNSSSPSGSSNADFSENITSQINFNGNYNHLNGTAIQVDLTVNVLNEAAPALARNFTIQYENANSWAPGFAPSITDYGTGQYTLSFGANISQIGNPLPVSLLCEDQRGIFVGANMTCMGD